MSEELYTKDEISHQYTVLGHSVDLINKIIAETDNLLHTTGEKKDCVRRNVEHLEIMVAKDYWTTEDMTAVNKAITDGKGYL
tara:strand:+ start:1034 stop:1279 length:246 start_codon:yes stop_codon:yes gene_type:complete